MENQDIRNAGLKVTLPRVKILGILESSGDRHMSAEDVYRMLLDSGEEIGLATVYRVLTQFESAGSVAGSRSSATMSSSPASGRSPNGWASSSKTTR